MGLGRHISTFKPRNDKGCETLLSIIKPKLDFRFLFKYLLFYLDQKFVFNYVWMIPHGCIDHCHL